MIHCSKIEFYQELRIGKIYGRKINFSGFYCNEKVILFIVASFWPDVSVYIDSKYEGKMNRSANPFEIVYLYGCYTRNEDLSEADLKYTALQMPYYWDDGILLVANLGKTGFIDYAHKYGISMQYWMVNNVDDTRYLAEAGADLLMTDYPDRIRDALED